MSTVSFSVGNVTEERHHFGVLSIEKLRVAKETPYVVLWENAANCIERSFDCPIQTACLFSGGVCGTDIGEVMHEKS